MRNRRLSIITLLAIVVSKLCAQTDVNSLSERMTAISLPYTTQQGHDINGLKSLSSADSTFLLSRLQNKLPTTVNPYGNSPFGQIDCQDTSDCLELSELKEVAALGYIKLTDHS